MKYRINRLQWLYSGLMACVLAVSASAPVRAQEAVEGKVHTIEVRDGKVWVNGEAVTELDDDGRRIIFKHGDGDAVTGRDPDFHVRSGNFARYFTEDPGHRPFVFEFGSDPFFGALEGGFPSAEILRLEQEARRLAERIRTEDGEPGELEDELDDTLGRIFELKMASNTERVEKLESRLRELRDRIEQRQSDREAIIEQRKQELLGRRDRYEW